MPGRGASRLAGRRPSSWREPLDRPALAVPAVPEPVVQPVVAVLPELVRLGSEHEAAPDLRSWDHAFGVARPELLDPCLQLAAAGNDIALPRRRCRELGPVWPCSEVRVRVAGRHPGDDALDADLPAELVPVEAERRTWVRPQLEALPALVARVEQEAVLASSLQEHEA